MNLDLGDMFTSDLHFGHKNILVYQEHTRPVKTLEEMEDWIIEQINNSVSEEQRLFILGDLFFNKRCSEQDIRRILDKIKTKKIFLVPGNHDYGFLTLVKKGVKFDEITVLDKQFSAVVPEYQNTTVKLNHYPPSKVDIEGQTKNFEIYLHGHIHGSLNHRYEDIKHGGPEWYTPNVYVLDVGIDYCQKPIQLKDIFKRALNYNPFYL